MRRTGFGAGILAVLLAGAASQGAGAATAEYPVGVSSCEGEAPLCNPAQHFEVTTEGALGAELAADPDNCTGIVMRFAVDGVTGFESQGVAPGASTGVAELGPVPPGTHTLSVEADVPIGVFCDFRSWAGTLLVTTSGTAAADVATAARLSVPDLLVVPNCDARAHQRSRISLARQV